MCVPMNTFLLVSILFCDLERVKGHSLIIYINLGVLDDIRTVSMLVEIRD